MGRILLRAFCLSWAALLTAPASAGLTPTTDGTDGGGGANVVRPSLTAPMSTIPLNDSGQTQCFDGTGWSVDHCTAAIAGDNGTYPRQDASVGRDAAMAAGQLTKIGCTRKDATGQTIPCLAGFDFTAVCHDGTTDCTEPPNLFNYGAAQGPDNPHGGWSCTKDNVTGLTWALFIREAPWSIAASGGYSAPSFVGMCGYTDWRVPTRRELISLLSYGRGGPVFDTQYFPGTYTDLGGFYWSTNRSVSYPVDAAWGVSFVDGSAPELGQPDYYWLRMVRGEPAPAASYTTPGDGTVTDNATGLTWDQSVFGSCTQAGTSSSRFTFQAALQAVKTANACNYKGHDDWRLPNIKELESLVSLSYYRPAADPAAGLSIPSPMTNPTWSSSGWIVRFHLGDFYDAADGGLSTVIHFVRLVRGGSPIDDYHWPTPLTPRVDSISPSAALSGGGTSVTIRGAGFVGVSAVHFGAAQALSYTVNSANSITATAPAGAAGSTVDVTVTTSGGTSATSAADRLSYVDPRFVVNAVNDSNATSSALTRCNQTNASASPPIRTCSLRDAVAVANMVNATDAGPTITFDPAVFATAQTITLTQGKIDLAANMTIVGSAAGVTIDGNDRQILMVHEGASASVRQLTFAHGNNVTVLFSPDGQTKGGAIYNNGTLSLTNCSFVDNQVTDSYFYPGLGGAIFSSGILSVASSTFSGNRVRNDGGAIQTTGRLTVTNSTFDSNEAGAGGGAIRNVGGTLVVINSVFSRNSARGAGNADIFSDGANATVTASNNVYYHDPAGAAQGNCTHFGAACDASSPTSANPLVAALADNGGPTQTMLALPGSRAICAGTASLPGGAVLPSTDQRGAARTTTSYSPAPCVDAGAVQTHYALAFATQPSNVAVGAAMAPAPVVALTENGRPFTAAAATINLGLTTGAGTVNNPSAMTSTANDASAGRATFFALSIDTVGTGNRLTATLALNSNPSVVVASAPSLPFDVSTHTPTYAITTMANPAAGGTITCTPNPVNPNSTSICSVSTNAGYTLSSVSGCGGTPGTTSTYTTGAINAACTVTANFATVQTPIYAVTGMAGPHGSVSPALQNVASGGIATLTITPDSGYAATISGTCPGGGLVGNTYTSGIITADCAIVVLFSGIGDPLSLLVSDGRDFARYGSTARYLVTVANNTSTDMDGLNLSASPSPALDTAAGTWCTVGGTAQQPTCTPAGSGPFNVPHFAVPARGVMIWAVSIPVLPDAPGVSVDYVVRLMGSSLLAPITQADSDTLVLFRDGFDHENADGTGEPPIGNPQP